MRSFWMFAAGVFALCLVAPRASAAGPELGPNKSTEPVAKAFSLEKGGEFLDAVSLKWSENRKCITCHTNMMHLMARSAFRGESSKTESAVRDFFEAKVANWDRGKKGDAPPDDATVVATAAALAFHDGKTGKLHPRTREALDRMWTLQQKDGAFNWNKCSWPPTEHDDYFGAVLAALATGVAPENYAASEKAKAGLAKLRGYFTKTPPPNLHHKGWLLWASLKVEGLMTREEREKTTKELLALQHGDGGWSLASLGDWQGFDGRDNDPKAPSDGYGTGFAVFVLRQAGLPKDHAAVAKGVAWLKANQRESGRWFTRSLNTDRAHYVSHAGSAFALLALRACE